MKAKRLTLNGCPACRDGKPMYDESLNEIECEQCGLVLQGNCTTSERLCIPMDVLFAIWNRAVTTPQGE